VGLDVAGRAPVIADDDGQVVDFSGGFEGFGDVDAFGCVVSAVEGLVEVHADAEGEVGADFSADGVDDLQEEAHPPGQVAAVFVVAVVGGWGEEPFQQVVVVGVEFDAVESGCFAAAG